MIATTSEAAGHPLVTTERLANGSLVPVVRRPVSRRPDQRGMVSAEWAVGIIAAISLVGVLILIITKGPVRAALADFIVKLIASFSKMIAGN